MEPSAVIPNYDQTYPFKGDSVRGMRRPPNLSFSALSTGHSPETSPSLYRVSPGSDCGNAVSSVGPGPFIYVGPQKTRYHAFGAYAPYPLPCGLEELTR
jgi:hypothetical protein